jgi:hypothetical protein
MTVIVVDDALRTKVASALAEMAVAHPRSIAAAIRGECFDSVVEETSRLLDVSYPDFECALIAAVSKVREKYLPRAFYPRRVHPNAIRIWNWKNA